MTSAASKLCLFRRLEPTILICLGFYRTENTKNYERQMKFVVSPFRLHTGSCDSVVCFAATLIPGMLHIQCDDFQYFKRDSRVNRFTIWKQCHGWLTCQVLYDFCLTHGTWTL